MLRIWIAMGIGVAALMVSGVIATMARAQTGVDPASVVAAYETARNRRDLDAALGYFADDATVSQRTTTFSGKDEIRRFLDGASARSRFVVVTDRQTTGNRVSWTERSGQPLSAQQTAGTGQAVGGQTQSVAGQTQNITGQSAQSLNSAVATNGNGTTPAPVSVEAIVRDGKIRSLAYVSLAGPGRIDPALDGRAQLPASAGLGAVVAVMLGVLMVGSVGLRRRVPASSSLHGRLMHDLQGWKAARQSASTS